MQKILALSFAFIIALGLAMGNVLWFQQATHTPTSTQEEAPKEIIIPEEPETPEEEYTEESVTITTVDTKELMSTLIPALEELRGHKFQQGVNFSLVTVKQLANIMDDMFLDTYGPEELAQEELMLKVFGLAPIDFDLEATLKKVYSQGVAGLYDGISKQIYIVDMPQSPLYREMVILHELNHALEDQIFDIEATMNRINEEGTSDEALAYVALVEGTATVMMNDYLSSQGWRSLSLVGDAVQEVSAMADWAGDLPPYLESYFSFPYLGGETFVRYQLDEGYSLDELLKNPPSSTSQILHPFLYPVTIEPSITLTFRPDNDWKLAYEDTLGEWHWQTLLEETNTKDTVSDNWMYDRVHVWQKNNEYTIDGAILFTVPKEALPFEDALASYLNEHFPNAQITTWIEDSTVYFRYNIIL